MAKETGLAWSTMSVDDSGDTLRAIKGDVTSLDLGMPRTSTDVTGVDGSAIERLLLLADFTLTLAGVVNDAADTGAHTVLKTITSDNTVRSVSVAISSQLLVSECLFTSYQVDRATSGELTFAAAGMLANGTVPAWTT